MTNQSAATVVTVPPDLVAELDRLADATGRSRSELVGEALAEYLDIQRAQIEGVHAALRDLETGRPDLTHEEVRARFTARLDAIYGPEPELSDLDPVLRALQARSIPKDGW